MKRAHRAGAAAVALVGVAGVVALLIASSLADGVDAQAGYAVGAALIGAILGFAIRYVRVIFVDSFKHPTTRAILERRENGDGSGVSVRVIHDPTPPMAHRH
jgi:hypothetical protein